MQAPDTPGGKILELDGFRGILSLMVLSYHLYPSQNFFWAPATMDFFFAMSGFLITRILLRANRLDWPFLRTYAARRILRIWPMYYIALLLSYGLCAFVFPVIDFHWNGTPVTWQPSWLSFGLSLAFLQNLDLYFGWPGLGYPPIFGHSWSVAIEEQFYFLWPLLLLALRSRSTGFRCMLMATAVLIAVGSRCVGFMQFAGETMWWLLPMRLDSLAAGAALAVLFQRPAVRASLPPLRWLFRGAMLLALFLLLPYLLAGYGLAAPARPVLAHTLFDSTLGFSLLAFGMLGLIVLGAGKAGYAWLRMPWLVHMGEISYSTYLLHILVLTASGPLLEGVGAHHAFWQWAFGMVVSLSLAHLTYKYLELPALQLKRYFPYRKI